MSSNKRGLLHAEEQLSIFRNNLCFLLHQPTMQRWDWWRPNWPSFLEQVSLELLG